MSTVTEAQIISSGAICSLCSQAFSNANRPIVSDVPNKTYRNKPVQQGLCRIPPYVTKHTNMPKDTTIKTVYQVADNKAGFITIMSKDLDKPEPKRCPTCNSPITEDQKLAQKAVTIKKGKVNK